MKHPVGCAVTVSHNQTIGRLSMEQWWWQHINYVLKRIVNRASTTFGLEAWKMHGLCSDVTPNHAIGRFSRQKHLQQHRYYVLKMSVNGASTTFGHESWTILGLCGDMKQ
jgi:hypothetical protein